LDHRLLHHQYTGKGKMEIVTPSFLLLYVWTHFRLAKMYGRCQNDDVDQI